MATYTTAQSGNWSAGSTWVGGVMPPSGGGHKPIIAATHQVIYDLAAGVYGDDTSSTTVANNAVIVNGTLKFTRAASASLTCRGTIAIAPGGALDIGTAADPIPAGVTATLALNDSAALAIGKHGLYAVGTAGSVSVNMHGVARTRHTVISSNIAAGATSIQVSAADNWGVGDAIEIASDNDTQTRSHYTTIAAGYTPGSTTVPLVAAVNFDRLAGCPVINLTSNVIIKAASSANPAIAAVLAATAGQAGSLSGAISNIRIENICSNTGWVGAGQSRPTFYGLGVTNNNASQDYIVSNCAFEWTHGLATQASGAFMSSEGPNYGYVHFLNCVGRSSSSVQGNAYYWGNACNAKVTNTVITRQYNLHLCSYGVGAGDVTSENERSWCSNVALQQSGGSMRFINPELHAQYILGSGVGRECSFSGGTYGATSRFVLNTFASDSGAVFYGPNFTGITYTASITAGVLPSQNTKLSFIAVGGDETSNRNWNYYRDCTTDTSVRRRSTYSVRIKPLVANSLLSYKFTIPAVAGVAQVIKGSLRFDATYGTATPPIISLSGQGVTASYACAAVADAWDDFTLSFTPTSTGDITATITVQSASTAGYAWLDGVYHYPMIQAVRHWGYQWLPQAAQLVDSRITLSEAAALALPVAVNHSLSTVTITGAVTPSQALQAMLADLAQTANNARAVHCTGDGSTFTTSYTVILSGAGAVSGSYTDATGLHVSIVSSALDAGTLVQVWDVAAAAELYIGTPSGSLSLPIVYPGTDKTLRLRAMQCGATSASRFVEQLGTLTSAGASFLVTQAPDTVYAANAIDGSTVTGITIDDALMRFVLTGRTSISWAEIYAYETWWLSTVAGMRDDGRIITAIDPANYVLEGFQLRNDNPGGAPITITGGWGRNSVTGQTITLIDTTGGPIFAAPDAVIAYGQSAATPAEIWSHTSRTLTSDPGAAGHAATQAAIAALPAPPSAAAVASATRTELAPELAATLQARDLAEADEIFTPGTAAGTGLLSFKRRGTAVDLIPAKTISGTSQAEASGATQ